MQAVSTIDFNRICLTGPTYVPTTEGGNNKAPFSAPITGDMRFAKITYPSRPPIFTLTATVSECSDTQFGAVCLVKPDVEDLTNLETLENLLTDLSPYLNKGNAIGWSNGLYDHRPTMTDDYKLRLKMTTKENGQWKFETEARDMDDALSIFEEGTRVEVQFTPGFYFNDSDCKYGLYLTLKSLRRVKESIPISKTTTMGGGRKKR